MPAVYGNLRIVVLKGRKLTDKTFVGTQAPYLVIEIGEERMVTKVDRGGGTEPSWNQQFDIQIPKGGPQSVHIEAWSKELFSDTIIGKVDIPLDKFYAKTPREGGWWKIISKQYAHKIRGEILFKVKLNGRYSHELGSAAQQQSAARRRSSAAPPPPPPQAPKMIWQVALKGGVSVRTKPELNAQRVTYDGKKEVVLDQGSLLDSDLIQKSLARKSDGSIVATYWVRHKLGWSCCKYGHTTTMVPLSDMKIFESICKKNISSRLVPGLGQAKNAADVLEPGEVILGRQIKRVREKDGKDSTWILHRQGWSCASYAGKNFIAEIMYRRAFEVVLAKGLTVRHKPSLSAKVVGVMNKGDVAVSRETKAHKESTGELAIWMRHAMGWSCLKLGSLCTMIPLGGGQAWFEVTADALSVREAPGKEGKRKKQVLSKHSCVASRGLFPVDKERGYWLKSSLGYSCFRTEGKNTMRLKLGVEMWRVTHGPGLYIRAKPGAKKHVLGLLKDGEMILSRGMIALEDHHGKKSIWIRHGRGWTCISYGGKALARVILGGKQKPAKLYKHEHLHGPKSPSVLKIDVGHKQKGIDVKGKVLSKADAKAKIKARSEQEIFAQEKIVEAQGVAVVTGEIEVINPPRVKKADVAAAVLKKHHHSHSKHKKASSVMAAPAENSD